MLRQALPSLILASQPKTKAAVKDIRYLCADVDLVEWQVSATSYSCDTEVHVVTLVILFLDDVTTLWVSNRLSLLTDEASQPTKH